MRKLFILICLCLSNTCFSDDSLAPSNPIIVTTEIGSVVGKYRASLVFENKASITEKGIVYSTLIEGVESIETVELSENQAKSLGDAVAACGGSGDTDFSQDFGDVKVSSAVQDGKRWFEFDITKSEFRQESFSLDADGVASVAAILKKADRVSNWEKRRLTILQTQEPKPEAVDRPATAKKGSDTAERVPADPNPPAIKADVAKAAEAANAAQMATEAKFFTVTGRGKKVVYLCQASGSMLSAFGAVKERLKSAVYGLDAAQEFNVIFFQDEDCLPAFKDGPQSATLGNKKLATDFINGVMCGGSTQPLPAIKFAIDENPDVIFVFTDGFSHLDKFDDVTNAFRSGNPNGKITINSFFFETEPDAQMEDRAKQIAKDGRGSAISIPKSELEK